jgi:hypothetical protein
MYDDTFDQRRDHNDALKNKYDLLENKLDDMSRSDA